MTYTHTETLPDGLTVEEWHQLITRLDTVGDELGIAFTAHRNGNALAMEFNTAADRRRFIVAAFSDEDREPFSCETKVLLCNEFNTSKAVAWKWMAVADRLLDEKGIDHIASIYGTEIVFQFHSLMEQAIFDEFLDRGIINKETRRELGGGLPPPSMN